MTVTQRRARADPNKPEERAGIEPGIKYTCDVCGLDITNTVRIKCAAKECEEVDLCPICFSEGKEVQRHKAWHDYKVVEQHSKPIFTSEWGADEELLLISGLIQNGLGNWAEAAEHVGTRTKEECENHYLEVYLGVGKDGEEVDSGGGEVIMDVEERHIGAGGVLEGISRKRRREFMPPMDRSFNVDPDEFQARKKARIEEMRKPHALPLSSTSGPLVSAPTNHEVAGFMPGRLEFEHEVDNEAEMAVKDMEFGLVFKFGGDEQPEAAVTRTVENDEEGNEDEGEDEEEDEKTGEGAGKSSNEPPSGRNGVKVSSNAPEEDDEEEDVKVKEELMDIVQPEASGSQSPGSSPQKPDIKPLPSTSSASRKGKGKAVVDPSDEIEDEDELEVKLAMLDIYFSKLDKREEAKEIIFDRCLTEHKRILANDRKRPKDERELIQRYKVFAKMQTAEDFEVLIEGLIYEQNLRKRIAELQEYRRVGITTGQEAEVYDNAKAARAGYRPVMPREREVIPPSGARINAGQHRFLHGTPPPGYDKAVGAASREPTPRIPAMAGRKPPTPLNLANAQSLDLLSSEEKNLCSSLRVLPRPYLTIKELYIRENERRKGFLKRRDARRMLKIDVNKSGRIFDFLVSAGFLSLAYDPTTKVLPPGESRHQSITAHDIQVYPKQLGSNGFSMASPLGVNGHVNGNGS